MVKAISDVIFYIYEIFEVKEVRDIDLDSQNLTLPNVNMQVKTAFHDSNLSPYDLFANRYTYQKFDVENDKCEELE